MCVRVCVAGDRPWPLGLGLLLLGGGKPVALSLFLGDVESFRARRGVLRTTALILQPIVRGRGHIVLVVDPNSTALDLACDLLLQLQGRHLIDDHTGVSRGDQK